MNKAKYFTDSEFKRCTPSCSIDDMNAGFLATLDKIREKAGIPLVITCAYRSVAHEKSKGRSGNSAHTKGLAVDIRCTNNSNRYKIINAAIACGINRIGIAGTYIHIDQGDQVGLPKDVSWMYDAKGNAI